MANTPRILGISDEVTVCEHCGRSDLKRTVALDFDGDVRRYGTTCAHHACFPYLSNSQIERIARDRQSGTPQYATRTVWLNSRMSTVRERA